MNEFHNLFRLYTNNIDHYVRSNKKSPPSIDYFNSLPIHFDKQSKKIGITFSGGADSTLLLYILCYFIKKNDMDCKIYPITALRYVDEKPWLEPISVTVLDFLKNLFPNTIENQSCFLIPKEFELVKVSSLNVKKYSDRFPADKATCDVIFVDENANYFIKKYNLDWTYTGVTTNPPIAIPNEPKFRNYKETMTYDGVITDKFINPFRFISKEWIVAQYYNLKLEKLLNLTRSCQADIVDLNLQGWNIGDEYPRECGQCFFCLEKKWAIDNMKKYLKEHSNE